MPMLSGEGAVLQQKPSGRGLDGPGPGAYSQPSSFAKAMKKPSHAVTLEERQNRGLHTESSNYRGYAEFYKAGSPPRTQED